MPGEDTHALRAQLAVALRERDEARAELARHETCIADNDKAFDTSLGECLDRAEKAEAERDRLETAARAYIEGHELALTRAETAEAALAAARRECEGLREALAAVRDWKLDDGALHVIRAYARSALAAPAAGEEAYRCPHGRGANESCRFCSVTGETE